MPTPPRVARAVELAAQLDGAGVSATHDPAAVPGMAPCVLIPPPRLSFDVGDEATASWRVLVIASTSVQLDAWQQLDALIELVAAELYVETAEPTSWALAPGEDPRPAYVLTITD